MIAYTYQRDLYCQECVRDLEYEILQRNIDAPHWDRGTGSTYWPRQIEVTEECSCHQCGTEIVSEDQQERNESWDNTTTS